MGEIARLWRVYRSVASLESAFTVLHGIFVRNRLSEALQDFDNRNVGV